MSENDVLTTPSTAADGSGDAHFVGSGAAGQGVVDGRDLQVANTSGIRSMLWVGFYTLVLNILTLTLFRFWGRTHFRRRLWSQTTIGGEPLEYTGTGLELFLGFLIASVVLMVPFLSLVFGAQLALGPQAIIIVMPIIYIALFILIGVAIFLARRYHLSRTRYRGVRFAQTGSAWGFGVASFGYLLLTGVTLGWFGPAARLRLSRRMWSNAYYGSARISFEDTDAAGREPVYKSFAVAWVGALVVYGFWAVWLGGQVEGLDPIAMQSDPSIIAKIYLSTIPLGLLIGIAVAWHEAVMTRRIIKSLRVANLQASSTFSTLDIIGLTITNILLVVFTLGVGFMAAQMRLWKRIANRMSFKGDIDFGDVSQTKEDTPRTGEGLADGLDVGSNF